MSAALFCKAGAAMPNVPAMERTPSNASTKSSKNVGASGCKADDNEEDDDNRGENEEVAYSLPPANRSVASASYLPDEHFAAVLASQADANANSKRKAHSLGPVSDKTPAKKRKNVVKPRNAVLVYNPHPLQHPFEPSECRHSATSATRNTVTTHGEKIFQPLARSQGRK
ncbi:hypothetical protein D9619_008531 [Psilocybe cf. subviscida]|uniref:Uncharacterized protein n=1 Tax=Psilocybe cf. subviscida TaxID=2480587 RepID=A0A8H5B9C2_9AGAR|nr:hypothetical protein D9619_008531 [Psilocybe cf. subviscida]